MSLESEAAAIAAARVNMAIMTKATLLIRRSDRCEGRISFACRVGATIRDKQPRSQQATKAIQPFRAPGNAIWRRKNAGKGHRQHELPGEIHDLIHPSAW